MESLHNPHTSTVSSPRNESTGPAPPQSLVIAIKTLNTSLPNMAPTLQEETTAPQSYSIKAEERFMEVAERLCREESREAEKTRDEAKAAKAKARAEAKARTKATILKKHAGVTKSARKPGRKFLSTSHLPICFNDPTTNTPQASGFAFKKQLQTSAICQRILRTYRARHCRCRT